MSSFSTCMYDSVTDDTDHGKKRRPITAAYWQLGKLRHSPRLADRKSYGVWGALGTASAG